MIGIMRGVFRAVTESLKIKPGEEVAVITDHNKEEIGRAFALAAEAVGGVVTFIVMKPTGYHGAEPPRIVAEAMKSSDVFIAPTTYSLTHTKARAEATKAGARGATLPLITEEVIRRAVDVDYKELKSITDRVYKAVKNAHIIKVTNRFGTLLRIDVSDRQWILDDGDYSKPGKFGNLPAGSVYIAPKENNVEGKVVFHSFKGLGEGIVTIKGGKAIEFRGELGEKLKATLAPHGENAFVVAAFGIGTNPNAKVTGNLLEDEKALGSVFLAFGRNVDIGGKNDAPVHEEVIILEPTIEVDAKPIMVNGKLLI